MLEQTSKHVGCPCRVCLATAAAGLAGLGARVQRALMREWNVDTYGELPNEVLPALALVVGITAGLHDLADLVNRHIEQGYQRGKAASVIIPVETCSPRDLPPSR
jgi:hypothetical protein